MSSLSTKYLRNEGGSPLALSLSRHKHPRKHSRRKINVS